MKFSEYLRKLDEGNLGHELEKQERAKKEAEDNTVKEPSGETMLDPKTGKPFPKKGPLKDWQVPSLRESERPGEAINYGRDEEDESPESTPVITNPAHPDYKANDPHNVRRRNNSKELADRKKKEEIQNRMKERDAREARLSDTIAHSEAKRKANESVETPERDVLGRLSIYSMNEASKSALRRRLASSNVPHAEKQRAQANLNIKDKDSAKRAEATAGDPNTPLDVAVRAGDAMGNKPTPAPKKQRVLTPSDKANANKNAPKWVKKKEQDAHDVAAAADEADFRSGGEGTPRQKHRDK